MLRSWVSRICLVTLLTGLSASLNASDLTIQLTDELKQPVADAVVELIASTPVIADKALLGSIAQEDLSFVPFVSAYAAGTYIEFPNRDKTRHHVYSFSPAKSFEIQLYAGKPEAPIVFDKPGIVTIGCNIHDYMQAYVYIGTSPLLAVTDSEGKVRFNGIANDSYQLKLWHPWQKSAPDAQPLLLDRDSSIELTIAVQVKQKPKAPKRGFGS